ncbi:21675_t:CDS:2, partial [Racocetra persica]
MPRGKKFKILPDNESVKVLGFMLDSQDRIRIWSWKPEEVKVANVPENEYTVCQKVFFLKKESLSTVIQKQENGNEKNKDFWRYRLKHIIPNNNGNCPMCYEEIQTNEHFGVNCKSSKIIWEAVYSYLNPGESSPRTYEEIITISNIKDVGKKPIPEPALPIIVKNRIEKEFKVLNR